MTATRRDAIVLFAHGARDPAWGVPLERLAALLAEHRPSTVIVRAFLELQTPTLDEAVARLLNEGPATVVVMPVFWARAGHVAHELDPAVEVLRGRHPESSFDILPVLSELPGLLETIAATVAKQLTEIDDQRTS
ncbi:hypothetical protein BH10PSE17_BH10PSE17_25500 [soil metagenome]